MAKLETQINQIYLSPQEGKKLSLILFEEKISPTLHLFLLAELKNIQKKTEANDLNKISEIIIESFKANKKLDGEVLFESTLAEINNELAEFAHKGRKSWLGKFSGLIAVQSDKDFYLANTGATSAWLKRKNSLNEILSPDKSETHPLKTFLNFSAGRLVDGDQLVLTTSSIFNYISVELFSRTINSVSLSESCGKISDILKSSAKSDEGFAVFMLGLAKKAVSNTVEKTAPAELPQTLTPSSAKNVPPTPIYAPMPEDLEEESASSPLSLKPKLPSLSSIPSSIPKFKFAKPNLNFNFKLPAIKFLPNVSGPAKFFLISFVVFVALFAMNIAAFSVRNAQQKQQEIFNANAEKFVNLLSEAESSLLYKNQSQAMKLMADAESELIKLRQLNESKAKPFEAKFEEMNNKINRVTVLKDLTPAYETTYPITFLSRAGSGYLVANENPNSLGVFNQNNELNNQFMLNKTDGDIFGIAHVSGMGNYVISKDKIYKASSSSKEFEQVVYISNAELSGLKFTDQNRLYSINKTTNQVVRVTVSANSVSSPQNILKTNFNLSEARDFAVDTDVYVLFPDKLVKFVNGTQASFQLGVLSEPLQNMTKIRIGNQIYLLEPISQRVLIYNKRGELLNQVHFPALTDLKDLYVDETLREMLLVNGNKIYRITF